MSTKRIYRLNYIGCSAMFIVCLYLMAGCSKKPDCSTTSGIKGVKSSSCLVVTEDKVLVVKLMGGRASLVEDSPRRGESAQCAAERAVWDQTGLHVRSQSLLDRHEQGYAVFSCTLLSAPDLKVSPEFGVVGVDWVPVNKLEDLNWQNEHVRRLINGYF